MSTRALASGLRAIEPVRRFGHVKSVHTGRVHASGPLSSMGDLCTIACRDGEHVLAEVAAVEREHIVLVPFDHNAAILPEALVVGLASRRDGAVGDAFSRRAVDALGQPIDGRGPVFSEASAPIAGNVLAPFERAETLEPLETGVRALDGLLTLGRGQRIGIFSASGVGKTTLVRQIATQTKVDHCVLCLVGERGREVEQAWRILAERADGERFTCVAATSDLSAPLRARAVYQALCLAEHWRDAGKHVLLVVDSVTRFAMALREIGLAAGAPPTLRAYTPNVFAILPRIVERCGAARTGGAITAVFTVLCESDDLDDPIAETMKSLLDGHILLSRTLAEQGHFPPIDVVKSVSRQSERLMHPRQAPAARQALSLLSAYEEARVMIESGLYKAGANPQLDDAIRERRALTEFLRQRGDERTSLPETVRHLERFAAKTRVYAP